MAVKIVKNLVPESKYPIKCPNKITPTRIVVHNTANDASARDEIAYMISNNNETSYHFAVDDKEVVQGLPLDRNGWHAGDGLGPGNMRGIGIEICYSKSGGSRFIAAEKLAAKLIAQLLKERGWGIGAVTKHQDYMDKYCPHRTLDMGWQRFLNMVSDELAALNGTPTSTPSKPAESLPDVFYRVKTKAVGWLPQIKNLEDYAGIPGQAVTGFMVKASKGSIKYRAHIKGGSWLPWVTGYNVKDAVNGFAGDFREIDAIQIYYVSPGGEKHKVKYRVSPKNGNYYDWQTNVEKTNGQDGYAGAFGRSVDRIQIVLIKG